MLAFEFLLDLLAAAIPDHAIGFEFLGLAVNVAGAADQIGVAAIPLVALRGRLRIELPLPFVELAVLLAPV